MWIWRPWGCVSTTWGEQDRQTQVPEEMLTLMRFIERPHSPDYMKAALRVLVDRKKNSHPGPQRPG